MSPRTAALKKLRLVFAAVLVLAVLCVSSVPNGGFAVWNRVFSFFGLGGFSSCADGWPASVHVIDVGKADSILIECGVHHMLVDGGTPDRGEDVVRYLRQRGISDLDEVINTHPDEDHVGGLKYVLQAFPVKRYFAPKLPSALVPKDSAYLGTMSALKEKNIMPEAPVPGENFLLGGMTVEVLGPVATGGSTNDNSSILMLRYGNIRFLLMGDAEKEEELSLISSGKDLSADVLKVGHHGSSTSTSQELLQAVKPSYAAISVGYDLNRLPKQDVLERLFQAGVKTYRTDVNGTVIFLTDGKNISVRTER